MAVGGPELPPSLEGFLASRRSLDALLSPSHYHGGGEVARQLRAVTAAWATGGQQGPAPVGVFAAALFAKVKSFPEAAAALAAADGGASLDGLGLVQRLEPALQDLKQLSRPAERQRISTELMLGCLAKLEPADGTPDFCIDSYGLAVSPYATRPSPFAWEVDHRLPVACGGATDAANLEAVQHRFNHYKRDRIIDPELHRRQILGQMAPHTYVTASRLQQLAAELEAQASRGKEPSYHNVEALLRCKTPWSAHYASSSSDGGRSNERALRSEAGRLVAGRRRREEWSAGDEQALAVVAAKHALQAIRRGGSLRMNWKAVAAELGTGRSGEQCRNKWRRLLQRPEQGSNEDEAAQQSEEEEEAGNGLQQQPRQGYRFWSEEEADIAAQLLGAVGSKLAAGSRFAPIARTLPAKLEAACQALWHMPLTQRLPRHTPAQVTDKCCSMVKFAIELARNKQLMCKQYRPDRGLTPQQWQHLAPHLLLLANSKHLPLSAAAQQLVASEEAKEEVRRFVEDPPLAGEPRLPRLQDYWPPVAPQPAEGIEAGPVAGAAAAVAKQAAGSAASAPRQAAAGGRPAAGKVAGRSRESAGAPAAKAAGGGGMPAAASAPKVAAATAAVSLAEAVIDLTLSDSEDEESQAVYIWPQGTAAPPARGQRSLQSGGGGSSSSKSSKGSKAVGGRAVLADANQQQAAAAPSGRRRNRKTTEEERVGIHKLWLRYGNQWECIRQEVERDPALCGFLERCNGNKTEGQTKIKDLARKWVQPAEQKERQQASGRPEAA